jgi:DNA polymerase-3 subunit gamma/tau
MATTALYNKWRGQTFEDILGQEHITRTLRNQIRAGRVGHAYLFTGLRGTGKTSTARILAKAVNCIGETDAPPCNQCRICRSIGSGGSMDLIEIDAASNRGIDEIRELRERVAFSPSEARFKVYVIDEVHMLTNEAFNALLKTLEEPPAHVIFVLCTTEPHRLPETILSRCQRFDFRRAAVAVVMEKLYKICEHEGIAITSDALEFVARKGGGSFRDAESLLDQLAAYGSREVTLDLVQQVLGAVDASLMATIIEGMVQGDMADGLAAIGEAMDRGAEPRQFLGDVLDSLRAVLLLRIGGQDDLVQLAPEALAHMRRIAQLDDVSIGQLVGAIKRFNDAGQAMRYSARPQIPFELAYIESALEVGSGAAGTEPEAATSEKQAAASTPELQPVRSGRRRRAAPAGLAASHQPVTRDEASPVLTEDSPEAAPDASGEGPELAVPPAASGGLSLDWIRGHWNLVLLKVNSQSRQVRALLNSAYPIGVGGDVVTLGCEGTFHRDRLQDDERRKIVEDVLGEVVGAAIRVSCTVDSNVRQLLRSGETLPKGGDLFTATSQPAPATADERQRLLEHPAVKELQKLGGVVSQVRLESENEGGVTGGKQR